MKRLILALAMLLVITNTGQVKAEEMSAERFLKSCPETPMFCIGFIRGLEEMRHFVVSIDQMVDRPSNIGKGTCLPEQGISYQDLFMAYAEYFDKYPEKIILKASTMYLVMLRETFPCP
jgi:hypothetical protein